MEKLIAAQPAIEALDQALEDGQGEDDLCLSCPSSRPTPSGSTTRFGGDVLRTVPAAHVHRAEDGRPRRRRRARPPARGVGRRGKYLLLDFGSLTFVVHLMQGGRLQARREAVGQAAKGGLARWVFDDGRRCC